MVVVISFQTLFKPAKDENRNRYCQPITKINAGVEIVVAKEQRITSNPYYLQTNYVYPFFAVFFLLSLPFYDSRSKFPDCGEAAAKIPKEIPNLIPYYTILYSIYF